MYAYNTLNGRKDVFESYKHMIRSSEDIIDLQSDTIKTRMANIKEILRKVVSYDLTNLKEYFEDRKFISKKMKPILLYFESPSHGFQSLLTFVNSLNRLKLFEDDFNVVNISKTNSFDTVYFKSHFKEIFDDIICELKKNNDKDYKILPALRALVHKCLVYLSNGLMSNEIFFPIEGAYNVDYYFTQIQLLISNAVIELYESYHDNSHEQLYFSYSEICKKFKIAVKKLQDSIVNDLCEVKYMPEYLSKVLGIKIENLDDYVEVEKIVCDYHNMIAYLFNEYDKIFSKQNIAYVKPNFDDGYSYQLIKVILIKSKRIIGDNHVIKVKYVDGGEFILNSDDYLVTHYNHVYVPFEKLRDRIVQEIEIFDRNTNSGTKFNVLKYFVEPKKDDQIENETFSFDYLYKRVTSIYTKLMNKVF